MSALKSPQGFQEKNVQIFEQIQKKNFKTKRKNNYGKKQFIFKISKKVSGSFKQKAENTKKD